MSTSAIQLKTKLKLAPMPPTGVKYVLTVPQSVLFAELSLQGNRREFFMEAMGLDYEPSYIAIDTGGAMSWNYDNDAEFNTVFIQDRSIDDAVASFIAAMGTTARKLDRRSSLGSSTVRRRGNSVDILEDLLEFWHAYKLHMTNLFIFWNVEALLGHVISHEMQTIGFSTDNTKFDKFVKSKETNQFIRERRIFEKLVRRFADTETVTSQNASPDLLAALEHHIREFSFLLTPFNLGSKPSAVDLLERVSQVQSSRLSTEQVQTVQIDTATPRLKKLLDMLQQLTFWKNERLDALSMADARMEPLYQAISEGLSVPLDMLFAMTSDEIVQSLENNKVVVEKDVLASRSKAYCLILNDGVIDFYQPLLLLNYSKIPLTKVGAELSGVIASKGKVAGTVRIIESDNDLKALKPGDILVTNMTRPEFGSALDRAAAFVTDEGGLLCHAAIISREMGKPCITNTEFGTKLLRSGMIVTVDANLGLVIINKL